MKWRVKSFALRVLGNVIGGKILYYYLQNHFGGFRNFSIASKIDQGLRIIATLHSLGYSIQDKNTLEIGTGWSPIVPMLFHILGQHACYSFDVERLLKAELSFIAAEELFHLGHYIAERAQDYGYVVDYKKLTDLATANEVLELLSTSKIYYYAPVDVRLTDLTSRSIDVVFSITTLEHIPLSQFGMLFSEIRRLLSRDGVMVHLVDCSDHYSHSDNSISVINFLKYSDQEWAQYNNGFLYQNRLRPNSYKKLAQEAGFDTYIMDTRVSDFALTGLPSFPLAGEFLNLPLNELCATSFLLIGKP